MKTPIKPNTLNIVQLYWRLKEMNGSVILPANETSSNNWKIYTIDIKFLHFRWRFFQKSTHISPIGGVHYATVIMVVWG